MRSESENSAPLTAEERQKVNDMIRKREPLSFDNVDLLERDGWSVESNDKLSRLWELQKEGNCVLDWYPGRGVMFLVYKKLTPDPQASVATINELRAETREARAKIE